MKSTYSNGDIILVKKNYYKYNKPKRNDIVLFSDPYNQDKIHVKRIIGLPDENIVLLKSGKILINSNILYETNSSSEYKVEDVKNDYTVAEWNLSQNEFVVLSDNRSEKYDSRRYGPIKDTMLIGKVKRKIWPIFRKK